MNHKIISKYNPIGYINKGKSCIVKTKDKNIVIKKSDIKVYEYLKSRGFNYYPSIIEFDNNYIITEYIEEIETPEDQKILDLIDLVSLLHYKTTYYKDIDDDEYKKIYEDIKNNIEYLYSYYSEMIDIIENNEYYSPSEIYLLNNISILYSCLNYTNNELEKWLGIIENKKRMRYVILHNNLSLDHFLKNDKSYLISFDKSIIDIPIFDLYKLYKRYSYFDFYPIFKRYEKYYKLTKEERLLLFILISLPDKIELNTDEDNNMDNVIKLFDNIYSSKKLIEEYSNNKEDNESNKKVENT